MGIIAAEPGWQAVYLDHGSCDTVVRRWPVVAWNPQAQATSEAFVLAPDQNGATSVQLAARVEREQGLEFVGFFHPERYPEWMFHGEAEWVAIARDRHVRRQAQPAKPLSECGDMTLNDLALALTKLAAQEAR